MNLAPPPRKLQAAHRLLAALLSDGRPHLIAECLEAATEHEISPRTLYEARARLPIECPDRDYRGKVPGHWRLTGEKAELPEEWKRRRHRHCKVCGSSLAGTHWRRKRCEDCKKY